MRKRCAVGLAAIITLSITLLPHLAAAQTNLGTTATWGVSDNSSFLSSDQGGSIELGQPYGGGSNPYGENSTPYIDFHFGNGESQDYNYRIFNNGDGLLTFASTSGATLQLEQTDVQVNQGVDPAGGGLKHVRTTGCDDVNTCSVTVSWAGTPFPDTNYTATCTLVASEVAAGVSISSKSTSSMTVQLFMVDSSGLLPASEVDCIAMHD